MNDWYEYVVRVAGSNQTRIEENTGIKQSTVAKWKRGVKPSPAQAARLALESGSNVLEAFVAAGFLTAEQANARPTIAPALGEVPPDRLVRELAKRLGVELAVEVADQPVDDDVIFAESNHDDEQMLQEESDQSRH